MYLSSLLAGCRYQDCSPLTSTQTQCMGVFGWRSRERPLSARQHPDWWWLPLQIRTCWCNDLNHRLSAGGEQNTTCSDSMEQQRNKNWSCCVWTEKILKCVHQHLEVTERFKSDHQLTQSQHQSCDVKCNHWRSPKWDFQVELIYSLKNLKFILKQI